MTQNKQTEKQFLADYDATQYERPSVATDIVIFTVATTPPATPKATPTRTLRVLLIQRGQHPFQGQWALPGGFLRPGETVGQCARRELAEETGITVPYLEQLYTFSRPHRDPRTWVLSCAHMALIDAGSIPVAGDDAAEAAWFDIFYDKDSQLLSLVNETVSLKATVSLDPDFPDEGPFAAASPDMPSVPDCSQRTDLPEQTGAVAFDHAEILVYALHRLRRKLEYTDLAFHLVPEVFTLPQLQSVYELILGKKLSKSGFRYDIIRKVEQVEGQDTTHSKRPSALYKKAPSVSDSH